MFIDIRVNQWPVMRAPTIPRPGLPVTVGAAFFGLFGNDDAKYGQDGVSRIETNQTQGLPRPCVPTATIPENSYAQPLCAYRAATIHYKKMTPTSGLGAGVRSGSRLSRLCERAKVPILQLFSFCQYKNLVTISLRFAKLCCEKRPVRALILSLGPSTASLNSLARR